MADDPKFKETWTINSVVHTIEIHEVGVTHTTLDLDIISDVRVIKGDAGYDHFEPILESQIMFMIRDSSKTVRAFFAGKKIGDLKLTFTVGSTVEFVGFVVPEFQRYRQYLSNPSMSIRAFDGIAGLKGFSYDQGGAQTVRDQLFNIFNKIGLTLASQNYFEWKHNGADVSTEPPDALRVRVENLIKGGGSYYDALETIARFYNAQAFQRQGEWFFMQRALRGATMTNRPTTSAGAGGTAVSVDHRFLVLNLAAHREETYFFERPALARVISRHSYDEYKLRNGDFTQGLSFWENSGGSIVAGDKWEGDADGSYVQQEIGLTFQITKSDPNGRDRVTVHVTFEVDVDAAATGTGTLSYAEVIATEQDGTQHWMTTSQTWSATQVYLTQGGLDLDANAGSTVTYTDVVYQSGTMPAEPLKISVKLIHFEDPGVGSPYINKTRFVEAWIVHLKPDDDVDIFRPEEEVVTLETAELGDEREDEFIIGDSNADHMSPGVLEYYDGTDWLVTQDWDGAGETIHAKRAQDIVDQTDFRLKTIDVSHKYGEDVDLHNALVFDDDGDETADVYPLIFVEKNFRRNGKIHCKSTAVQLLDAVSVAIDLDYLWWAAFEDAASPANINAVYKSTVPSDLLTLPWETDSEPSDKEIINVGGASSSDAVLHLRVDRAQNVLFYTGDTTNTCYKSDLDGGGLTDSGLTAWGLAICVATQKLYIYNLSTFVEYDYNFSSIQTVRTKTVTVEGTPAVDQSGTYMFSAMLNDGGTTDRIIRIDLSTLTKVNVVDMSSLTLASLDTAEMLVDEVEGLVFFLSTGTPRKIYTFPYPGGGSLTQRIASAGRGMALDRGRRKIIYSDTTGDIYQANYDGSNPEKIYDYTSNLEIYALDVGHS